MRADRTLAYIAFGVVCLVWGTTYAAIAVAIETLPTFLFAGLRFAIAGALLLIIRLIAGDRLPSTRREWLLLTLIGFFMVGVGNVAVVWAEHYVPSGFAALMVATAPLWMALLEALRPGGIRLSIRAAAGLVIGFAGVALLVAPELRGLAYGSFFLLGVVVLQLGSIGWNIGSILGKYHLPRGIPPLTSAALQMLLGGIPMVVLGLASGEGERLTFTTQTFLAFIYLVVFGSMVAYAAYVFALSHLPTSTTSLYAYLNPIVAVTLGWAMLNEPIGWNALAAMVIIFSGVALVQTGRAPVAPAGETLVETGALKEELRLAEPA